MYISEVLLAWQGVAVSQSRSRLGGRAIPRQAERSQHRSPVGKLPTAFIQSSSWTGSFASHQVSMVGQAATPALAHPCRAELANASPPHASTACHDVPSRLIITGGAHPTNHAGRIRPVNAGSWKRISACEQVRRGSCILKHRSTAHSLHTVTHHVVVGEASTHTGQGGQRGRPRR